jgi:pimeloyl-ACP methyl ester carboxylesterase
MISRSCAAFVIAGSVIAAALLLPSAAPPAWAGVSLPPFYEAVAKIIPDGKLGDIVMNERVPTTIAGAQAWRIAYVSSDIADRKTVVTALLIAPTGEPPPGGRPVVAWAHGTTGTAQNCGPSQVPNPAQPLNEYFLLGGNSWTDYGVPAAEEFIRSGYVLVATDYQGLGGGGRHQYMVSVTQARDAIDSIRAAGAIKETGAGKEALIYGWSQGGSTVINAASMPEYIGRAGTAFDGIHMAGFVALAPADIAVMAPAGNLDEASANTFIGGLRTTFAENIPQFTHLAMSFWAIPAAFPELELDDVFTEEGAQVVDEVLGNKCVHAAADTFNYLYGKNFGSLLQPEPGNAKGWAQALLKSSVPPVKPVAPVIIYWGNKDVVVPPVTSELYRAQMCKRGGNVARAELAGEQTHFTTPPTAEPLYVPWIKDRFAGKLAPDGCAAP